MYIFAQKSTYYNCGNKNPLDFKKKGWMKHVQKERKKLPQGQRR